MYVVINADCGMGRDKPLCICSKAQVALQSFPAGKATGRGMKPRSQPRRAELAQAILQWKG